MESTTNAAGFTQSRTLWSTHAFLLLPGQTYDIEFTNASPNGKKIKNARITSRLNGILIHENFAIPRKTGGARSDPEGTPGSIKLQGHGNPLQFRNIWILEK